MLLCICTCIAPFVTQTPINPVASSFESCAIIDTNSPLNLNNETVSFHLCAMRDANPSLNGLIVTSLMAASIFMVPFVPCVKQTPPQKHPSWLQQRCSFAPCATQTPPLMTCWYIHRDCTVSLIAMCVMHAPPNWTLLEHPSKLQFFTSTLAPLLLSGWIM